MHSDSSCLAWEGLWVHLWSFVIFNCSWVGSSPLSSEIEFKLLNFLLVLCRVADELVQKDVFILCSLSEVSSSLDRTSLWHRFCFNLFLLWAFMEILLTILEIVIQKFTLTSWILIWWDLYLELCRSWLYSIQERLWIHNHRFLILRQSFLAHFFIRNLLFALWTVCWLLHLMAIGSSRHLELLNFTHIVSRWLVMRKVKLFDWWVVLWWLSSIVFNFKILFLMWSSSVAVQASVENEWLLLGCITRQLGSIVFLLGLWDARAAYIGWAW